MLIAAAAAIGTIVARVTMGRGAAIIAALFAVALRGLVALIVGTDSGCSDQLVPAVSGSSSGG